MHCASMCKTNSNCEAYYIDASQCHEGGATNLIGSSSNLPSSQEVYMEQSIYANNKGKCINAQKTEQVTLYLDFSS